MAVRTYVNGSAPTTITGSVVNTDTTITLASAAGFPGAYPFTAAFDLGNVGMEVVLVTAVTGATATVVRGYDNTVAQAHASATSFTYVVAAVDFREANGHVNATHGVHGITGNVVGDSDTQTLTGKTLISPTVTGGTAAKTLSTGDATTAAVRGQATTSGGVALAALNSAGTQVMSVNDAGNISTSGALAAGGIMATGGAVTGATSIDTGTVTATGAVTAGSVTTAGAVTAGSLSLTGAGTFSVAGSTTLAGTTVNGQQVLGAQAGAGAVTLAGTHAYGTVNFPTPFNSAPTVIISGADAIGFVAFDAYTATTTGFQVTAYSTAGTSLSRAAGFNWIAFGS